MSRFQWIEHRGRPILSCDFSRISDPDELFRVIEEGKSIVRLQPKGSLLSLFDVQGLRFSPQMVQWMKDGMQHNTPYVRASAFLGLSALQRVVFMSIQRMRGRQVRAFDDRTEALDWLVAHSNDP